MAACLSSSSGITSLFVPEPHKRTVALQVVPIIRSGQDQSIPNLHFVVASHRIALSNLLTSLRECGVTTRRMVPPGFSFFPFAHSSRGLGSSFYSRPILPWTLLSTLLSHKPPPGEVHTISIEVYLFAHTHLRKGGSKRVSFGSSDSM